MCLDVQNLVKVYQGRRVVDGLSFKVGAGEVVGLLGPNGAGKTTAFYMAIGLISPDHGKVFFKSNEVTSLPLHQRAKMGMGYLAQEPSVFRNLTVEDNILCILENMPLNKHEKKRRLEELLEELHLTSFAKQKAVTLSGGERRRVEITRALVTDPTLLLLDEPFANIDPISVSEVQAMVRLLAEKGIGILVTDHNAREIFSVASRSYLMTDGRLLMSGSVEELMEDPEARRLYLGSEFRM